jgi:hypothetical protein
MISSERRSAFAMGTSSSVSFKGVTQALQMLLDKVPVGQFQGATFELTSDNFIRRQ